MVVLINVYFTLDLTPIILCIQQGYTSEGIALFRAVLL